MRIRATRLVLLLAATTFLLALTAAPAFANSAHVFSASFGASGSGDGQLSLVPADPNVPTGGSGVAVNSTTHDLYVADTGNARIDQFSSAGTFIRAFGADVGGAGIDVCTTGCVAGTPGSGPGAFTTPTFIAVDNSGGDVYVGDTTNNVVTKFDATGNLITSWGDGSTCPAAPNGQLSGACATDGPFGSLAGVAVDTTGNLFVYDQNARIFSFAQDGTFTADFSSGFGVNPSGIAVDSSDNLYVVRGAGFVEKLGPSGNDLGAIDSANQNGHHDTGLALDPSTDELYVDKDGTQIDHYAPSSCHPTGGDQGGCTPAESFGSAQLTGGAGLAVDSATGTAYAADADADQLDAYTAAIDATTGAATDLQTTAATLHGTVNPDGTSVTDCHFDYGTTTAYGQTAPCAEAVGSGTSAVPVHADLTGLTGGTTYHFRLVAADALATARGDDQTFSTLPVPVIHSVAATNLTPTTADLNATVNPAGLALSDCHFEYGTDTSYGTAVPCSPDAASIPADSADHPVSAHLTGLTPDTTYHFRVLATDANGTTTTTDHTFIYDTAGQGLPDTRAYEQVTPPNKNGALIAAVGAFGFSPQVSEGGSGITASSIQCFADAGSCHVEPAPLGSPYAFTRTPAGWTTTALSPPATQFPVSNEFSVPNPDDATALFSAPTQPSGEDDLYARQPGGSFTDIGPLTPPAAGSTPPGATSVSEATPDLSHVLWQAGGAGLWPFDATTVGLDQRRASVYEYVGPCGDPSACETRQPLLVGVSGGPGSTDLISTCGTALGGIGPDQGSLSTDGRTAFFTARRALNGDPCPGGSGANAATPVPADALYARIDGELPDAHTVPVSERSPADCTGACLTSAPGDAAFEGASADGSRVFFTSTQQLTDAASQDPSPDDGAVSDQTRAGCQRTTHPNGCNLYLYDASKPSGHELSAVSAGDSSGGGPRVQGVVAISRDGSHVYFVANGALAPGAGPGDCHFDPATDAVVGHCNLYAYDAASGDLSFVASLPGFDHSEWDFNTPGGLSARMASVTPDGRFLVFSSHGTLTPDDTSASGAAQIFRYDAQTGDLARISIGEKGFADNGNRSAASPCGFQVCSEDASVVPQLQPGRTDPTMSHDGAYVFFNSPLALTPHALDDVQIDTDDQGNPVYAQNVYEWHGGHLSLISDGRDTTNNHGASAVCPALSSVCLLGVDGSGQNVFFTSADRLVPQDTDTELDFYDARVGGGIPFTPPPQPCQGDNCKPPPSGTPTDQTPGSLTANGPGDPTPSRSQPAARKRCKKHHKKCKRSRRANTNRGGSK